MGSQPKLFKYGIQLERSDVRVHVSPSTRRLYVFPTAEAQQLLDRKGADYDEVPAFQPGVEHATALGKLVPFHHIPKAQVVTLDQASWWVKFKQHHATNTKGRMATEVVLWALRNGRLPLWIVEAGESRNIKLQRSGTDILVWAKIRIQVKCDWTGGPKEWGGSGHLFLQQAERNPRGLY